MLSQAVFPQLEPADPTTSATLTANLELKKLVLEAEALFTQEKLAEALKSYEKINDKYPEEAWVKYRLSVIYQRSNYDYFRENENEIPSQQLNVLLKSICLAEQAVALQPQNHIYLIHLAQLQANNKPHKAANLYHQAMLLQPRSSSIYGLAAEHAAKQIRYQLLNENPPITTTHKQTAISPFTDTLIHIAQRYKNQFGINATYVEMMVYAYSRMPNKEAEKNALLADWNKSQQLTNNPVNSTNETATNTAAPEKKSLPQISQRIHESEFTFNCARLYYLSTLPDKSKETLQSFAMLEENYPYIDWTLSKNYYTNNASNAASKYPIVWPTALQLKNLNPASALLIWQNINYLAVHPTEAPNHYLPFIKSVEALETNQSVNPLNYKQLVTIIEYLLKTFNSNAESATLMPLLTRYKNLEDFK